MVIMVTVCHSTRLLRHNNDYNYTNENYGAVQDGGPDVETARGGAVVSGTLMITNHLPISALKG